MSYLKISIKDNFSAPMMKKLRQAGPRAEHAVAVQIESDTEPFVPALTKSFVDRTQVVDGTVIYPGPYARFLYNGKLMIDPDTGSAWAQKGATKVVAGKDLDIKQDSSDVDVGFSVWETVCLIKLAVYYSEFGCVVAGSYFCLTQTYTCFWSFSSCRRVSYEVGHCVCPWP